MSYNIIVVFLGLYIISSPFLMLKFLKTGYKMGSSEEFEEVRPILKRMTFKKSKGMEEELGKIQDSLANIEAYNGTPTGQKEVR